MPNGWNPEQPPQHELYDRLESGLREVENLLHRIERILKRVREEVGADDSPDSQKPGV